MASGCESAACFSLNNILKTSERDNRMFMVSVQMDGLIGVTYSNQKVTVGCGVVVQVGLVIH